MAAAAAHTTTAAAAAVRLRRWRRCARVACRRPSVAGSSSVHGSGSGSGSGGEAERSGGVQAIKFKMPEQSAEVGAWGRAGVELWPLPLMLNAAALGANGAAATGAAATICRRATAATSARPWRTT